MDSFAETLKDEQANSKSAEGVEFSDFSGYTGFTSNKEIAELTENGSDDEFDEFVDFEESEFETASSFQGQTSSESIIQNASASNGSTLVCLNLSSTDDITLLDNLNQVLDGLFPSSGEFLSNKDNIHKNEILTGSGNNKGLESVFSTPESLEIWQHISHESNEQLFQWKRSIIRKVFYASLGITIESLEEVKPQSNINTISSSNSVIVPTKSPRPTSAPIKPTASSSAPVSRSSTPNSLSNLPHNNISSYSHNNLSKPKSSTAPEQLNVDLVKSLCSISEETLQTFSDSQLLDLKSKLLTLSRQASDTLTYWLDQREQTTMDSETYNQMIECLVGHAQKIRDGGKQSKLGWDNRGIKSRKKATSAVASGLASLSLSFKRHKSQSSSPSTPTPFKSEVSRHNKTTNGNNADIHERPLSM